MRGLPDIVIHVLSVWYKCQQFYVKWGHVTSDHVSSGVRQGGILSPALFNACVDGRNEKLRSIPIACNINDVCFNHMIHADGTVRLVPSPSALQYLINACTGLNIFYSGIEYTEKEWMRFKVRYYPLLKEEKKNIKKENTYMKNLGKSHCSRIHTPRRFNIQHSNTPGKAGHTFVTKAAGQYLARYYMQIFCN